MKALLKTIAILLLGAFVGMVAAVSYAGPVDMPLVGLVLASVLVGAGAVSITAQWGEGLGIAYAMGVIGCTLVLFFAPPGEDSVVMAAHWMSYAWIALAVVVSTGAVSATAHYRRRHSQEPSLTGPVTQAGS